MSESPCPIVRVTISELRRIFNELEFPARIKRGEVIEKVTHRGIPSPEIGLPAGTETQMISYFDADGNELARVHQFVLPDGTIGASGKPDPKRLIKDGTMYRIVKS